MKKLIRLNLGCGEEYKPEWVNVDADKRIKAEIYADLNKKLPFPSNYADEIYSRNMFEHIPNPLAFLAEVKRVLKKGGKATIITSNGSYFIYHFPRRKAYHDSYNLSHPLEDQHYFFFQKGHLIAFTKKAGLKLLKLDYYIGSPKPTTRSQRFEKFIAMFIGKKFGYGEFIWEFTK